MDKSCRPLPRSIHWTIQSGWALSAVLGIGHLHGQSQPAIMPLAIHREAAVPGWIPGQWSWPATPPRPNMRWASSIGGRYHPAVPALSELLLSIGYSPDQDWLTLGISQQGSFTLRQHQICLGYSKSLKRNRAGLSLKWNRLRNGRIQSQRLSASLGSEQQLGAYWRTGFGLQHPMILKDPSSNSLAMNPREEPVHGLKLGLYSVMQRDPWLFQWATHYSRIEGWRNELGIVYKRSSGLGIVFSTDPMNTLFHFGICYGKSGTSFWTSTLYSPLPGLSYQTAWEGGMP